MGDALHNAVERFHQPQGPLRETLREGRIVVRAAAHEAGLVQVGLQTLPEDFYVLRVEFADCVEHRAFTKAN